MEDFNKSDILFVYVISWRQKSDILFSFSQRQWFRLPVVSVLDRDLDGDYPGLHGRV